MQNKTRSLIEKEENRLNLDQVWFARREKFVLCFKDLTLKKKIYKNLPLNMLNEKVLS